MKKIILTLVFTLGLFWLAGPVQAADIYVDGDAGSDVTGEGTVENPYQSVTQALTVLASGDKVYCKGTIEDSITLTSAHSGTAEVNTTLTVWPGESATLDGQSGDQVINIANGTEYLTISGLTLSNSTLYGITSDGTISNIKIKANTFNGAGTTQTAISISGASYLDVSNNTIHDFTNGAITFSSDVTNSLVSNNIIYYIGGSTSAYVGGIIVADSNDISVVNNSLYSVFDDTTETSGIILMTSSSDLYNITVENNIIHKSNVAINLDWDGYTGITINYNDYYANDAVALLSGVHLANLADWQSNTSYDQSSLDKDPLYVSTEVGTTVDLHVQSTSACIDAGIDLSVLSTDYDGEERPYNVTDIGADEHPYLITPSDLSVDPKVHKATLSWLMDSNYPVTGYLVKFGTTEDLSEATAVTTTEAYLSEEDLKAAKIYYYSVAAVYETEVGSYTSDYSEVYKFFTKPAKIKKVKFKKAKNNKLVWKKQKRVTGYIVKVMNKKKNKLKKYTVTKNRASRKLKVLTSNKNYKVKVRSYRIVDEETLKSKWSKIKKIAL